MTSSSSNIFARLKALPEYDAIKQIAAALPETAPLYLVGGSLRDLIMHKAPKDFDLTTSLSAEELRPLLEAASIKVFPLNQAHQTIACLIGTFPEPFEITAFHGPNASPEGSHIVGKSILEDLSFRDFTINAMALAVSTGKLFDPYDGQGDLDQKTIKAVGEATQRFSEDPLRIMRMLRIAAELDFAIDSATFDAAQALANQLQNIAIERVRDELSKILVSQKPASAFEQLQQLGILRMLLPELEACVDFEQNRFHDYDVFKHTLLVVENTEPQLLLRLTALLHDIAKPLTLSVDEQGERHFYRHEAVGAEVARDILKRFHFPNALINDVEKLIAMHMRSHQSGASGIRRILRDADELYPAWRAFKDADARGCKSEQSQLLDELLEFDGRVAEIREKEADSFFRIAINGNDIIALGVKPGPKIGDILDALKEEVLEHPEHNIREYLLQEAKRLLES